MEYWRGCLDVLDPNLFPHPNDVIDRLESWAISHPTNQTPTEQGTDVRQIFTDGNVILDNSELNKMFELWAFIRHYLTEEMAEIIVDGNQIIDYKSFNHMRRFIARSIRVVLSPSYQS